MRRDIDDALRGWPHDPSSNEVEAREVRARDGRTVVQIRIDLGVLQMEADGRPDGEQPRGYETYLDYLYHRAARRRSRDSEPYTMAPVQCAEADRELVQFYHRRVAMLALQQYDKALRDAQHSLDLIEFISDHGPDDEYIARHERLRGSVIFDYVQAAAALALERCRPEEAIEAVRKGAEMLENHRKLWQDRFDLEDEAAVEDIMPDSALIERLERLETEIRHHFDVPKTLHEQLAEAVAHEDYERAAHLRDQIRANENRSTRSNF